jgi:hypothetical protein
MKSEEGRGKWETLNVQRIRKLALLNAAGLRVPGALMADIFAIPPAETVKALHDFFRT